MIDSIDSVIIDDDSPLDYSEKMAVKYSKSISSAYKKVNGQFFTDRLVASFMANLSKKDSPQIRVLDPGCGMAILSIALIQSIALKNSTLEKVSLVAYETDSNIISHIEKCLIYLQSWLKLRGIEFNFLIKEEDYVISHKHLLVAPQLADGCSNDGFDIIISNPPYFKIPAHDERAKLARSFSAGQANIYSLFMAISIMLLNKQGEFIFITPRSYTSGKYFFFLRKLMLEQLLINRIHLFGSRTKIFNTEKVRQETLIIRGVKKDENNDLGKIHITFSNEVNDLNLLQGFEFNLEDIINSNSKEKIIHVPTSTIEIRCMAMLKKWENRLGDFQLKVSTGPVVAYRSIPFLIKKGQSNLLSTVPLIQLCNVTKLRLKWPVLTTNKPQFIKMNFETKSILVPNKNYLIIRRFSTKDDNSRLIAAPYFADEIDTDFIGIENHLNYVYKNTGQISNFELLGLALLFNSSLYDTYFRTFNGSTNVSASELIDIPLPSLIDIENLGKQVGDFSKLHANGADYYVNKYFGLENLFDSQKIKRNSLTDVLVA